MSMLFRATLFSGLASLVAMFAQAAKGKVAALVLGPEGLGMLTQLTLLLGFAVTVSGMGLQQGIIRYVSEYSSAKQYAKLSSLHSTFIAALFLVSCLISLAGVAFSQYISKALLGDDKYAMHVSLILLAVPFSVIAAYYQALLSGIKAIEAKARLLVFANVVSLPISIGFIYSFDLVGAILSLVVLQLVLLMLGRFYIKKLLSNPLRFKIRSFDFHFIKINSAYGVVGMVMVILSLLTTLAITSIITNKLGIKSTGIFSVTWQISSVYLGMFLGAITSYYYPTLCELTDHEAIAVEVNNAVRHFVTLLTPAVIILVCFNVPLITLLFSTEFLSSGKLLAYYLPGDFFRMVYETLGLLLLAKGNLLPYALLYIFWCASYLCLTYFGVDRLGMESAAISYTVSYASVAVLTYFVIKNFFNFTLENKTIATLSVALFTILISAFVAIKLQTVVSCLFGLTALYFYSAKEIKELVIRLMNKLRTNRG